MKGLMFEKNELFEEQAPGALEGRIKINGQLDELMATAVEDLTRPPAFLADVQQNILRCYEIERKAFQKLSNVIAE
jgi:hypothetical protein